MKSFRLTALALVFVCTSATASVHVWTGSVSSSFADATNWVGGSPAGDPDADLSFPGGSRVRATNDIAGLTVRSISISGGGYEIDGQSIHLISDASLFDTSALTNTITCALILDGATHVNVVPGDDFEHQALTLAGQLSGSGALSLSGGGRVVLSGSTPNTNSGATSIACGTLELHKASGVTSVAAALSTVRAAGCTVSTIIGAADEQIADSAPITLGAGTLEVGARETIGPLTLDGGEVRIIYLGQAAQLTLGGDIVVMSGGTIAKATLPAGTRHISAPNGCNLLAFYSLDGSGSLSVSGNPAVACTAIVNGTYVAPSSFSGVNVEFQNGQSAVTLANGSFKGTASSLVASAATIAPGYPPAATTAATIDLSGASIVRPKAEAMPAIVAGVAISLGGATLDLSQFETTSARGTVYTLVSNRGSAAVNGTFASLAEGATVGGAFRISYVGGDGNDITLTDLRGSYSSVSLSASAMNAEVGQPVNLDASVYVGSTPPHAATGTVEFRDGATSLGTASVNSGHALLSVSLPVGSSHALTAAYSGDAVAAASISSPVYVTVREHAPSITDVQPSSVTSGSSATITVTGTNFVPGSTISSSYSSVGPTTYVSPTQLQAVFSPAPSPSDRATHITVTQPGPYVVSSPFDITVTGVPRTISPLVLGTQSVTAPVTAGGRAAFVSGSSHYENYSTTIEMDEALLSDDDHDGTIVWQTTFPIRPFGTWMMADLSSGSIAGVVPGGYASIMSPFPEAMFLEDADGLVSWVSASVRTGAIWSFVLARPSTGEAWLMHNGDGGTTDLDGASNGWITFRVTSMEPIGSSAAAPASIAAGDLFMAVEENGARSFGDAVTPHLGEGSGAGTIRVASTTVYATESAPSLKATLMRTGGSAGTVSVAYATSDGTAHAGVDYQAVNGRVTFNDGEILKTIEVPLVDDGDFADQRSFTISISDPAGAVITGSADTLATIYEDDPQPVVTATVPASVAEGDSGERSIPVTVSLAGSARVPISVSWGASGDVTAHGSVTLDATHRTASISIPFMADSKPALDKHVSIGFGVNIGAAPARTSVTIVDDDVAIVSIGDVTVNEASGVAWLSILVEPATAKPVTVAYRTADGTAGAGSDFTTVDSSITITNSARTQITVPLINDSLAETTEALLLTLTSATNATIRRATAVVTILDDDATILAKPQGLTAQATSSSAVTVSWTPVSGAVSYEVYRRSAGFGTALRSTTSQPWFTESFLPSGQSYLYTVRAINSASTSPFSDADLATTIVYSPPTLQGAVISTSHFIDLRYAINAVRALAGLPAATTSSTIATGFVVKASTIVELRSALSEARSALGLPAITFTDTNPAGSIIKAVHLEELRAGSR